MRDTALNTVVALQGPEVAVLRGVLTLVVRLKIHCCVAGASATAEFAGTSCRLRLW